MSRAGEARSAYREDADREWNEDEFICSADLMKVTLIPIVPHKTVFFTPRLVVFNETFAALEKKGKAKRPMKSLAVIWHEATAGRDGDEIGATFWRFLSEHRDKKRITIYTDNCQAQNKSWVLATMLMTFVHQNTNAVEQITMKYLEKGHTSMSADSSHRQVQRNLSKRKVCDFEDFRQAVEDTGIKTTTMTHDDFFVIQDGVSQKKLNLLGREGLRPYLKDTRCLQVRRG